MEGYPLHFKYADYATIGGRGDFAQQMVVEELAKILLVYGVEQLAVHLQEAIEEADRKYQDYRRNCEGGLSSEGRLLLTWAVRTSDASGSN